MRMFPELITFLIICLSSTNSIKIVVIGGALGQKYTDANTQTVEIYDSFTTNWTKVADYPAALKGIAATSWNGVVFATGGRTNLLAPSAKTFPYEASRDRWTAAAEMTIARAHHAIVVFDGRIYAIGGVGDGNFLSSAEAFDPNNNSWSPVASMNTSRTQLGVGVLGDYIYAVGGYNDASRDLNSVEKYDRVSDKWSSVASLTTARSEHCVVALGGKLYAIGGRNADGVLNSIEVYDASVDRWTSSASTRPRFGAGAVSTNELIYIVGGSNDEYMMLDSIAIFNPITDLWTNVPGAMSTPRLSSGVALLASDSSSLSSQQPSPSISANLPSSTVSRFVIFSPSILLLNSLPTLFAFVGEFLLVPSS